MRKLQKFTKKYSKTARVSRDVEKLKFPTFCAKSAIFSESFHG